MPPSFELHHLSTAWSVTIAVGVTLGLLGATARALWGALRAHATVRAVRRDVRHGGALVPGPTTLRGMVESPEGSPVVLTIHQRALREAGGTTWEETSRELTASRFFLALDDGQRVLVEPNADTFVMVDLQLGQSGDATRTVLGKLLPGDRIHATGVLRVGEGVEPDGGYRGGARTLRLGPPREGRMRLCAVRVDERQASERSWAVGFLILASVFLVLSQIYLVRTFWPLVVSGARCEAEITQLTTAGGRDSTRGVWARLVSCDGAVPPPDLAHVAVSASVPAAAWSRLERGERLPFVVARDRPVLHQLGAHPHLEIPPGKTPFGVLEIVFLAIVLHVARRHGRPWYEKERVIDWEAEARR